MPKTTRNKKVSDPEINRIQSQDRPIHDWYRFVLSYPPHLVRQYLNEFACDKKSKVLDPFCGTGTTLVECKKQGVGSIGVEANRLAHFACATKLNWRIRSDELRGIAENIFAKASKILDKDGIIDEIEPVLFRKSTAPTLSTTTLRSLSPEQREIILTNSICDLPLHKCLVLLAQIKKSAPTELRDHLLLALASAIVFDFSNLHFGPEVGVTRPRGDAPVLAPWLERVLRIADDLQQFADCRATRSEIIHNDARNLIQLLDKRSISTVITSPPYPNEKDYTRTTRLESVILGFLKDKADLRALKQGLLRSNTRNVYKHDDDDKWVADHKTIQTIAAEIEAKRIALGKTSGFEKMYHRVTKLYFGGMARHFHELKTVLKPGAKLAYVVGDQASFLRVMIRTGTLLADIAEQQGYKVLGIDLFRTRMATATKEQLREEVVLLQWPGSNRSCK